MNKISMIQIGCIAFAVLTNGCGYKSDNEKVADFASVMEALQGGEELAEQMELDSLRTQTNGTVQLHEGICQFRYESARLLVDGTDCTFSLSSARSNEVDTASRAGTDAEGAEVIQFPYSERPTQATFTSKKYSDRIRTTLGYELKESYPGQKDITSFNEEITYQIDYEHEALTMVAKKTTKTEFKSVSRGEGNLLMVFKHLRRGGTKVLSYDDTLELILNLPEIQYVVNINYFSDGYTLKGEPRHYFHFAEINGRMLSDQQYSDLIARLEELNIWRPTK